MTKKNTNTLSIAQQFFPDLSEDCNLRPFGKGNINQSFLFQYNGRDYFLQKINPQVFPFADRIMDNIQRVYQHLLHADPDLALIRLISTTNGKHAWIGPAGAYWRVFPFILNSHSFQTAPSLKHAYESAKAVGRFLKALEGLDPALLHHTIPDFHNSMKRWEQMNQAIQKDTQNRLKVVREEVDFIQKNADIFEKIQQAPLPIRVVHNDTKMDNILFDKRTEQVIGLIDWDTIMPGTLLSDYGDLVRTSVNPIPEDSDQFKKIILNKELIKKLEQGFLYYTNSLLTAEEKELIPLAPLWITLEQAMRFLTDFLMGDVYYKIDFEEHNLVRARNQMRLFEMLKKVK